MHVLPLTDAAIRPDAVLHSEMRREKTLPARIRQRRRRNGTASPTWSPETSQSVRESAAQKLAARFEYLPRPDCIARVRGLRRRTRRNTRTRALRRQASAPYIGDRPRRLAPRPVL